MAGIGRAAMLTGAAAGIADARRIMLEDEGIRNQREDRKQVGVDRTQQRADQQHNRERQTVTEGRQDQDYERQEKDRKYNDDFKKVVRIAGMSKNLNPAVDLVNSQLPEGMKVEIKQDVDDKGSFRYKKIIDIDGQKKEEDWKDFDTVMTELMMASDPAIFEKIRSERASAATKASDRKAKQDDALALQELKNKGGVDKANAAKKDSVKTDGTGKSNNNTVNKHISDDVFRLSTKVDAMGKFTGTDEDARRINKIAAMAQTLNAETNGEKPYAVFVKDAFRIYDGVPDSNAAKKAATKEADGMSEYNDSKGKKIKEDAWIKARTKQIIMDAEMASDAEVESIVSSVKNNQSGSSSGVNPQAGNTPQDVEAAKKDPNIMYKYLKDKYSGNATDEEIIAKIQEVFGNSSWAPNQAPSQAGITR